MIRKHLRHPPSITEQSKIASLTVEAALVMPIFLYFMLAFLYFLQIFTIQEQIQATITKMGLNMSKTAYVYNEFAGLEEALSVDLTLFGTEFDMGIDELAGSIMDENIVKLYAMKYLDIDQINRSCIQGGFGGLSFFGSSILNDEDCIDIIVRYNVRLPIKVFAIKDMRMIQRVKLRAWTGYEVTPTFTTEKESKDTSEEIVYITETGSVYHKTKECSHIKLSIRSVSGVPSELRNNNGAKYYACEACCAGEEKELSSYYITSDGTRYHTSRDCSKLKRTVREILLSEVNGRLPCKRCGN